MQTEVIRVVADDREATCNVVEALRLHPRCEVEIRRLRLGDYQVGGRLLFERKTLRDLVSIIDGRFLIRRGAWRAAHCGPSLCLKAQRVILPIRR